MSDFLKPTFRGWTKPGPLPSGLKEGVSLANGESLDAISGYFRLFQLKKGHRFSTDDVLTAWYATSWAPRAETILELGSGIGTAGMMAGWRLPGARFVTVEAQEESFLLARRSAQLNGLTSRFDQRLGDFRNSEVLAPEEKFDLVIGTPPYFPHGAGVEGDHPQKIACRFESRGNIHDYCAVAASHLGPGGFFACIFPNETEQLRRVEAGAAAAGLTIVRKRPVVFKEPEAPLLCLFGMMLALDLPDWMRAKTWIEPSLAIRTASGEIHPEYSAVKLSVGFPP